MKKKVSLLLASLCLMLGMTVKPNMIFAQGVIHPEHRTVTGKVCRIIDRILIKW